MGGYGQISVTNQCSDCAMRHERPFRLLAPASVFALEKLKVTSLYPGGTVLFAEGELPRGVFIIGNGRVKVTTFGSRGEPLLLSIARAGDIVGVSATILGVPYEISAETIDTAEISFVRRDDFLRFIDSQSDAAMHAAVCCELVSEARMVLAAKQEDEPGPKLR